MAIAKKTKTKKAWKKAPATKKTVTKAWRRGRTSVAAVKTTQGGVTFNYNRGGVSITLSESHV